jgi:hypothetical protein
METDANSLPPISLEDKRAIALPAWYIAKSHRHVFVGIPTVFTGTIA